MDVEAGRSRTLFLTAVAVLEVQKGIDKLRRKGGRTKADRLGAWLNGIVAEFGDRLVCIDEPVARDAGSLEDYAEGRGFDPGLADVLIAASARVRTLTVLTANVRHFRMLDVPHLNPLSDVLPQD